MFVIDPPSFFDGVAVDQVPPAKNQSNIYTKLSAFPNNSPGVLYPSPGNGVANTGWQQILSGHWISQINKTGFLDNRGSWVLPRRWYRVSSVIDNGSWSANASYGSSSSSGAVSSGQCCSLYSCPSGFVASNYNCTPNNKGYNCYREDVYGADSGCISCLCCAWPDGFALRYCSTNYYYYYYDVWNPNWTTNYDILEYIFGKWVLVGTASVNTGATPLFT